MDPLTETQVRASFVNASKGEVQRLNLPVLAALDWDRLDLLGLRPRAAAAAGDDYCPRDAVGRGPRRPAAPNALAFVQRVLR